MKKLLKVVGKWLLRTILREIMEEELPKVLGKLSELEQRPL
jgi:hypothetical protein